VKLHPRVFAIGGAFGVHWRLNRKLFLFLGICTLIGVVIAITVVFNPKFNPLLISNNLLDTNLSRVIRPNIGLGAIMMSRLFSFAITFALVFVVCLHRWTVWLVFVMTGYQGFSLFISLYWTISRFGMATGSVLLVVYLLLLLALLVLTYCVIIFCMRNLASARQCGLRGGIRWREFLFSSARFLIAIAIFGFIEWILYWLILSKFVFVV